MKIGKKLTNILLPVIGLLILNFIYFYPVFQGKVLEQDDIMLGKAKGKEITDYRLKNNDEPLWTQSMFSGMPTFQMSTLYPNNWVSYVQKTISYIGGKPSSIYIIFSLMLGIFILLNSLKVNPWLSLVGAVAFGFSAFFIISYGAGHNAKVRTAAYIAPTILGIIMAYRGKYLIGMVITALAIALSINSNHFQITYYMALLIVVIGIVELIFAIKEKAYERFLKASGVLLIAAILGVGPNISSLWSTYEYTKETMRGGSSELSSKKESKGGLDFDYAMNWSYGIDESINLIIPNFMGGGMSQTYEGTQIHDQYYNNIVRNITSQGGNKKQAEAQAKQFIGSMFYWGDQSLVLGAYYLGAVAFFLFVLAFFVVDERVKWWVGAGAIMALILAWGKNFESINRFLFENLPIYNKFRVPQMALVILFFLVPFFGFYGANKIVKGEIETDILKKKLLLALYITGGFCLAIALLGASFFEFTGGRDAQLQQQGIDISLLTEDRISLMRKSALRTLLFCVFTFGALWFYNLKKLKLQYFILILGLLVIADQWSFVKPQLNEEKFVSKRNYEAPFAASAADRQIEQDPDIHYRVWNTTQGLTSDSYTSYHHKSISGYHGAKLIRYQDLIENQLAKQNMACFNMLNAKWIITGQGAQKQAQLNRQACGAVWFVDTIKTVANADAEMAALSNFNPRSTAIIDQRYTDYLDNVPTKSADVTSNIEIISYDPKHMVYNANVLAPMRLAVFSEIYYEGGNNDWKAYIDGEPVEHIRVNYLLRAMKIPQGNHKIEFKFEPRSYFMGEKISLVFSILMVLLVGFAIYYDIKLKKQATAK